VKQIEFSLEDFRARDFRGSTDDLAEILATQIELANFEFTHYRTPPAEGWAFVEQVSVVGKGGRVPLGGIISGKMIGEEINKARILANIPGGDMTPAALAEAAVQAGKSNGFTVRIMDEREIKKLGMGGVLGVAKGSSERPKFIVMEYLKGKKSEKPVVLVGKGVTFDTGGLNLKPESGIYEMHMDMTGGAVVIHTIAALARLGVKRNVIGLVPAVENMPSGSSYHPGDLLRTMSGKPIEVLNTDAEGRVILADALTYAKRYQPQLIVDVATLTGSAMSALGQRASAIFTTSQALEDALRKTGEEVGDYVWPLPLWEEFEDDIKGTFGDVANSSKTRYGGAITGAVFLWQFVKRGTGDMGHETRNNGEREIPWVHIDIAPRMTSIEGDFLAKGSAGPAVALLVKFLRKQ
jgi:leucyl aminopeptidase